MRPHFLPCMVYRAEWMTVWGGCWPTLRPGFHNKSATRPTTFGGNPTLAEAKPLPWNHAHRSADRPMPAR